MQVGLGIQSYKQSWVSSTALEKPGHGTTNWPVCFSNEVFRFQASKPSFSFVDRRKSHVAAGPSVRLGL
jgi:hypothetical protein